MTAISTAPTVERLEPIVINPGKDDGIISRLETLLPAIRSRRDDIERNRQLPDDLAAALRETGIFTMSVPRVIGGREAAPAEILRVIERVAAADGSAGWCTMVGLANNGVSGYMPESGAKEVFVDPSIPTAGIAAPSGAAVPVDGGFRVSGRWSFASGIAHCQWAWAGCLVMENGSPRMTPQGPEIIHVCLPVADTVIHDTWRVSGLCGTGSNDFSASEVFVPVRRVFALLDPTNHRPEPLYQLPPLPLFTLEVACVGLGIARSALDELTAMTTTKVPTMYLQPLAERAAAQVELARAETALGAARAYIYSVLDEMWQLVCRGKAPDKRQIALARTAAAHAAETAAAVTRTASVLGGGGAIYSSSTLQRHARDADALVHHFTVAPHTWEQGGRVLLGLDPIVAAF